MPSRNLCVALPVNHRVPPLSFKPMHSPATRFAAWLLGGLCAVAAAGCTHHSTEEVRPEPAVNQGLIGVRYAQTQCADRWGQASGPQQLVDMARAYLAQRNLTLSLAQASAKGPAAVCAACTCPTGLVLEGRVSPGDLPAVLALGFTEQ